MAQADTIFDEVMEISNAATADDVHIARLRIDVCKWMAGKLRSEVRGDKLGIDHQSGDVSMNPTQIIRQLPRAMATAEIALPMKLS